MARLSVNVRGVGRARRRVMQAQDDLSQQRGAILRRNARFTRQVIGAFHSAGLYWTPSPEGPPRDITQRPDLIDDRTGNLRASFRVNFSGANTVRLRWLAGYASYPQVKGHSRGYVQRTVRLARRNLDRIVQQEIRKRARRP